MRKKLTERKILRMTCSLLECDSARIESPCGDQMFMIIGYKETSNGEWVNEKEEKQVFNYLDEKVIAKGRTLEELWKDILKYNKWVMRKR